MKRLCALLEIFAPPPALILNGVPESYEIHIKRSFDNKIRLDRLNRIEPFSPRTSQVWNNLPSDLKSYTNIDNFTKAVSTINQEEILSGITLSQIHYHHILKKKKFNYFC